MRLILVAIGVVLAAINMHSLQVDQKYEVKSTALAAPVFCLGFGMLIHGKAGDATALTSLSRIYGFVGCGIANLVLYRLGFFGSPAGVGEYALVAFTMGIWLLPRRVLRRGEQAGSGPGPDSQ